MDPLGSIPKNTEEERKDRGRGEWRRERVEVVVGVSGGDAMRAGVGVRGWV